MCVYMHNKCIYIYISQGGEKQGKSKNLIVQKSTLKFFNAAGQKPVLDRAPKIIDFSSIFSSLFDGIANSEMRYCCK